MHDPKKVEIISLNEEDAIDMIVDQTALKMQYSNGKDDQVAAEIIELGDKTTNDEKIGKKDLLQLQTMINQSLIEQNESFNNEIDSLKNTSIPIKSFMERYELLEKYVHNSITELNGRVLLVDEDMNFLKQQFKDQSNKFVLGNTFNNLSKKFLELEKEISSDKDILKEN